MSMSLEEFRQAKESGIDLYAEQQQEAQEDAASAEQEQIDEQQAEQEQHEEQAEQQEQQEEQQFEVPKEQQTAFQKALDREKRKAREEAERTVKEQLEQQYNPYKSFFERLNIDPDKALEYIESNRIKQEAENLAYQNGWTDEQKEMYVRQQQLENKQTDMEVSLRIYELADTPDYPGIKQMKGAITEFIRSNPRATVDQAYWAVGGATLAQQLKREAEQRMIAQRQPKRTVVSDSVTPPSGPAPLPPEAIQFMRETGMSEAQVRLLVEDKVPKDLEEFRRLNKGRK